MLILNVIATLAIFAIAGLFYTIGRMHMREELEQAKSDILDSE